MKTKLLTICLLLFTSQVFAWTEKEYAKEYDACKKDNLLEQSPYFNSHIGRKKYVDPIAFISPYCHCTVHSIFSRGFTSSEIELLKSSENFETNKDVQEIFNDCLEKLKKRK